MTDKPIIFSAPMVRALLDGRKTQTRRVLNHKSIDVGVAPRVEVDHPEWIQFLHPKGGPFTCLKWPYAVGDRLWVRETWSGPYAWRDMRPSDRAACGSRLAVEVWHWADGNPERGDWERPRPSIQMPRWASRLTLTVTEVRVQRLQEISEADAMAEGYRLPPEGVMGWPPVGWFADLWRSLHGPEAWDQNPWVAALTFDVARGNIDKIGGEA